MVWAVIAFILGILIDITRSVLIPVSTDYVRSFFPFIRKQDNIQKNLINLEIMERLKRLNYDPGLIKNVSSDTDVFMSSLLEQKDKFIETSIEKISKAVTQTDMNIEAFDNMEISEKKLNQLIARIEGYEWISNSQKNALKESQKAWEKYAKAQVSFAALHFEGGTIYPLIYASEMDALINQRITQLTAIIDDLLDLVR